MTDRTRKMLLLPALALFLLLALCSAWNMPAWGDYRGPYGDSIARVAQYERHANDVVNAINYDYRAADTLGEEFILFTSVLGVMLLLRRDAGGASQAGKMQGSAGLSGTVRAVSVPAVWLTILVGLYIALHGQLSPGGGFQGGVILATAAWIVYIAVNPLAFHRLASNKVTEVIEALGAAAYAVIGLVPLLMGAQVLTNVVPLGVTGDVFSSGTIAVISACVGVEVTAAFLVVSSAYLQEMIAGEAPE